MLSAKKESASASQRLNLDEAEVHVYLQPSPEAWLARVHEDPDINSTFGPWLRVLPEVGEIFAPDGMSAEEISMLQGGLLVIHHDHAECSYFPNCCSTTCDMC